MQLSSSTNIQPRRPDRPARSARSAVAALAAALGLVLSVLTAFAVSSASDLQPASATLPHLRTLFPLKRPVDVRVHHADEPMVTGTRFRALRHGAAYGVRYWKPVGAHGRHVGTLRNAAGQRLAKVSFHGESDHGWQRALFPEPVRVRASQTYVVSVRADRGTYVTSGSYDRPARSSVLRFATDRSRMVGPVGSAQAAPWRRGAVFVDVLFSPKPKPNATSSPSPSGGTPSPSTSPSPAPSTTGSPAPNAACKAVPSACGYPDATNTGPLAGTAFTQVPAQATSGPGWAWNPTYNSIFVSGAGAVLNALDVSGAVVIDAPDVVVQNSRIAACGGSDDSDVVAIRYRPGDPSYNGANAQVLNNEILGTPAGCTHRARSGVRDVYGEAPGVVVDGNDISGTGNGVTIEHEGVVSDNWVHDLGHLAGDHHSGLSTHGGAVQVTFLHNTVLLHGMANPGGGGVSGAITVYSDFGHAQNTTIQDNFVSGGSYVLYGGNSGDAYSTPATGIKIRGNRFACGDWLYGPVTAFNTSSSGNEWTGNYCDSTGAVVNP